MRNILKTIIVSGLCMLPSYPQIASAASTFIVQQGGTGVNSFTAYAPIFGGTTSTNPLQSGTTGTSGQVLTSNGAGSLPTFQNTTSPFAPFTAGSVLFGDGTSTPAQDNANFFWNSTTHQLNLNGSFYTKQDPTNRDIYISTLPSSTTGQNNTLLGFNGPTGLTSAGQSTVIGAFAGASLTSGLNNTLVGYNAGGNISTGQNNTVMGVNAGQNFTSGNTNTIIGSGAGGSVHTNDSSNVLIGFGSDTLSTGFSNAIAIGTQAIAQASNSFTLGNDAVSQYRFRGVNYVFPASQGGASTALTNDGAGNLTWSPELSSVLTSAHLFVGNASNVATDVAASGDLSLANTGAFTFNTVNGNVGTFGTGTNVGTFTVNAKGLITAASNTPIVFPVTSVSNSDGTLTISPTTGAVIASLALGHANTWTGQQTFNTASAIFGVAPTFGSLTTNGGIFYGNGSGVLQQTGAGTATTVLHGGTSPAYSAVSLTADVSGVLPIANGGTNTSTAFTTGSVVFAGASGTYTQDNANFFWDDTNNFMGIGTATPLTPLQVSNTSTSTVRGIMSAQFNTGTTAARFMMRKARGTEASPSTIVTGDDIGSVMGEAYDGTGYLQMGRILMSSDGTIATNRIPTNMSFYTATDASPSVLTEAARFTNAQNFGVGTGATVSARIHAISTTQQLRLGFDTSNFTTFTVGSTGAITFDSTGTGPSFSFNKVVIFNSGLETSSTSANANFFAQGGLAITSAQNNADLVFGGATNVQSRVWTHGTTSTVVGANNSYASMIVGSSPVTIAATGTHSIFASQVIKPLTITAGAGTLTNSASLYVENASTGATNNYSFWSDAGTNRLDGITGIGGVTTPTALLHLAAGTASANTAPLKFTTGTLLTTPEDGAIEYNSPDYYASDASTRYMLFKGLTGSATLDFPNTTAGTCSDLTITVTGAADQDEVMFGVPSASQVGMGNGQWSSFVSAANTVTVRFCNIQALTGLNPPSGTYKVSVIKR